LRHIRDLAVSIIEDDITAPTIFDNVVRQCVFHKAISHAVWPYMHTSEQANLHADIQNFAKRTKSAEAAREELKLCVDHQVSAVNRHQKKQQVIVDDRKRLILELAAAQSELDGRLELRRKLMAILLERCSQVCLLQISSSCNVQLSPSKLEILKGAAVLSAFPTVVDNEDVFACAPKRKFSTAEVEGLPSMASEMADEAICSVCICLIPKANYC